MKLGITISEAKELFSILESIRKNIEIEDLEKRLEQLESKHLQPSNLNN